MAHQQRGLSHAVEDHDRLGQHEPQIRHLELVRVRVRNLLDEAHPVVADHADGAAEEARQIESLERHRMEGRQTLAQELERIAVDAQALRFTGEAGIDIILYEPSAVLTLNALDLSFAGASLIGADGKPCASELPGGHRVVRVLR